MPPLGQAVPVAAEREKSVPVPVNDTVCGLFDASSVIVKDAAIAPVVEGLKMTVMVQLVPAATVLPQLFVCEKSPLFVPVIPMFEIVSAWLPVLLSVTG